MYITSNVFLVHTAPNTGMTGEANGKIGSSKKKSSWKILATQNKECEIIMRKWQTGHGDSDKIDNSTMSNPQDDRNITRGFIKESSLVCNGNSIFFNTVNNIEEKSRKNYWKISLLVW